MPLPLYLVLLHAGFCLPPTLPPARCALTAPFHPYSPSPSGLRRSRPSTTGLPRRSPKDEGGRYVFCATFRQVALPGRYPAHCPVEFGLSSRLRAFGASAGDRLADCDLSIIKSQSPNPKTQIPRIRDLGFPTWDLALGIWDLGFPNYPSISCLIPYCSSFL